MVADLKLEIKDLKESGTTKAMDRTLERLTEHCKEPETEFTLCQQRLAMNAGRNSSGTVARTRALPLLRP